MKKLNCLRVYKYLKITAIFLFLFETSINGVKSQDTLAAKQEVSIKYFLPENKVPFLQVVTRKKVGRKFEAVKNVPVTVYFNEAGEKNLLGKVTTDNDGKGRIGLPPSFKNTWDSLDEFKFVASTDSTAGQEPLRADITIKKAILTIDTTSENGRTVIAELREKNGNSWVAVKAVDMKLSIKRMLGNLSVGDEETYTSDSTGVCSAEFKRDNMPGNEKGNITLVARIDDNDSYGNLVAEKTVAWGTPTLPPKNFFNQRTLWSTSHETPIWLLVTVCSIVLGIWGTIIYLVFQLIKIKRMGTAA